MRVYFFYIGVLAGATSYCQTPRFRIEPAINNYYTTDHLAGNRNAIVTIQKGKSDRGFIVDGVFRSFKDIFGPARSSEFGLINSAGVVVITSGQSILRFYRSGVVNLVTLPGPIYGDVEIYSNNDNGWITGALNRRQLPDGSSIRGGKGFAYNVNTGETRYFGEDSTESYWWSQGSNAAGDMIHGFTLGSRTNNYRDAFLTRGNQWIGLGKGVPHYLTDDGTVYGMQGTNLWVWKDGIRKEYDPIPALGVPFRDWLHGCERGFVIGGIEIATESRVLTFGDGKVALIDSLVDGIPAGFIVHSGSINPRGEIAALLRNPTTGAQMNRLLVPVPEPSAWLALGVGLKAVIRRRRHPAR